MDKSIQSQTTTTDLEKSVLFLPFLFTIAFILILFRSTYTISTEILYTEDATWLGYIYRRGLWHSLWHAKGSYLVFGNIIGLQIASILNWLYSGNDLTYIAFFVAIIQYCFYASCAIMPIFCFRKRITFFSRIISYVLILLLPLGVPGLSDYEIFGRISNIGYLVYFAAFCLLIYRLDYKESISPSRLIILDMVIFLCPTTNPACYILVGGFFVIDIIQFLLDPINKNRSLKALLKRRWFIHWLILGALLTGTALYTAVYLTRKSQEIPPWEMSQIIIFFSRQVFYPFVFSFWAKFSVGKAFLLLLLLMATAIIRMVYFYRLNENKALNFYLLVLLACVTFTTMTLLERPFLLKYTKDFINTFPDRYHYAQNCMWLIFFSILLQPYSRRFLKNVPVVIITYLIVLFSLNPTWIFRFNECPIHGKFRDAVLTAFEKDFRDLNQTGYSIPSIPRTFSTWLTKEQVFATILRKRTVDVTLKVKPSNFTDDNWKSGVNRQSAIVLFESTLINKLLLLRCTSLLVDGKIIPINRVELKGKWIWLYVNSHELATMIAEASLVNINNITVKTEDK